MSMTHRVASIHPVPSPHRGQAGIGLVQALLILLLVASALAAGALLLQAKRAPAQAVSQEQGLRWADEAIAAFASSNARLPCPASSVHGEEDCSVGAQGWLPLRSLAGASGNAPQVGPMAYLVYRGSESAHLDLTRPGNAYQPPMLDGSIREIISRDSDGEETGRRRFEAINGLDLCHALELAETAGGAAALANVTTQNGVRQNVAYGIAAAGPDAGSRRLDDANAGTAGTLEAPWREWTSGYDDRVRVRSFDAMAQSLGCRLQAASGDTASASLAVAPFSGASTLAVDTTPYNVSLAAMDVLAASITLHDALEELQASNLKAAESAVDSARNAQISIVFKLVTTAASLSDQITTVVTTAVSLTRAIITCIASLGASCAEVAVKAAALGTSIAGLGTKGVTLAQKAAALVPAALALDASIKARDMARKASLPPAASLEDAIAQMECTLFARNCTDESTVLTEENPDYREGIDDPSKKYRVVYELDESGNRIPVLGSDGRQLVDSNGDEIWQVAYKAGATPTSLEQRRRDAKTQWDILQEQVDLLEQHRLAPWGISVNSNADANGNTVDSLVENGRINERVLDTGYQTIEGGRYAKEVLYIDCNHVGQGNGEYDHRGSDCVYVGSRTDIVDEQPVTTKLGAYHRVERRRIEFNRELAVADAIARRNKAQEWAGYNLREEELEREINLAEENFDSWFVGSSSILSKMQGQRDDAQHCGASPRTATTEQKCENARQAVIYVEECRKPMTDASGAPVYAGGVLQYEMESNLKAACKPYMQSQLDELRNEQSALAGNRSAAADAYGGMPSPFIQYPDGWFTHAIEVTEDADGNPLSYDWKAATSSAYFWESYQVQVEITDDSTDPPTTRIEWQTRTRQLPYYAPEPYGGSGSQPILVTDKLELASKDFCSFWTGRVWNGANWTWPNPWGWGSAYSMGLYCQRYPFNRAFEDWRRAKIGADEARRNYDDLDTQYEKLLAEYENLKRANNDPSGGAQIDIGFGAEPALERADARGSVGPQELGTTP